jgi:hypothetical protein
MFRKKIYWDLRSSKGLQGSFQIFPKGIHQPHDHVF